MKRKMRRKKHLCLGHLVLPCGISLCYLGAKEDDEEEEAEDDDDGGLLAEDENESVETAACLVFRPRDFDAAREEVCVCAVPSASESFRLLFGLLVSAAPASFRVRFLPLPFHLLLPFSVFLPPVAVAVLIGAA